MPLHTIELNKLVGSKQVTLNAEDTDKALSLYFAPIGSKTAIAAATAEVDGSGNLILKEDAVTVATIDTTAAATDTLQEIKGAVEAIEGWQCNVRSLPDDSTAGGEILINQGAASAFKVGTDIVFDTSVRLAFSADLTGLRQTDKVFDDGGRQQSVSRLLVNATGTGPECTVYAVNDRNATYRTMRPSEGFVSGAETEIITPETDGEYVTEVGERLVVKVTATVALTTPLIHINGASYRTNA